MIRCPAAFGIVAVSALVGCAGNGSPSGPRRLLLSRYAFSAGQTLSYTRQNFDQNDTPVSSFQHEVEVLATGRTIGGLADAATVKVSTSGGSGTRVDTVTMAVEGGKLLIYDGSGQVPGRFPLLPLWNTLFDLGLNAVPAALLSFDSTFTLTMVSGNVLRDRVNCRVEIRYAGEDQISAFGAPIINCFVFTRTVSCEQTVDTSGVLLFQGPVITLLDSIWFADDIGPVKMTSRGNIFGVDSLGLPFSLSPLQVVHTPSSHDSYEVHYARVNGRDSLALRESLYFTPARAYTVIAAYARNF
ncbi:MAG TPA: hypothetical protein VF514_11150 [Bacteroidota bacterium]